MAPWQWPASRAPAGCIREWWVLPEYSGTGKTVKHQFICYCGNRKEFVSLLVGFWFVFFFPLSLLDNAFTSSSLESSKSPSWNCTIWAVCHQKSWFLPASSHYSVRRTLTLFLSLLIRLFLFWAFKEEARAFLPLPRSSCEEGCLSVPFFLALPNS